MSQHWPTWREVRRLARRGVSVPVFRELLADELTPVGAFARLSNGAEHAFLLESVVGGEKIARYSFVAANPARLFQARGTQLSWHELGRARTRRPRVAESADPLQALQRALAEIRVERPADSPGRAPLPRFTGGAVGYAAYDAVRYSERLPTPPPDDRGLPELEFGLYDTVAAFDHVRKTIVVISHAHLGRGAAEAEYAAACRRIDRVVGALRGPARLAAIELSPTAGDVRRLPCNFNRRRFEKAVERAQTYIRAGDAFQVVLSQRWRCGTRADPFDIYRALRTINPSPFMFFLRGPSCTLIGSSPEILCRVEDGVVTNRPLAGTRRRGATAEEDEALGRELLADPKDRAEHIMLVDLGRNDVGRVSAAGSVAVSDVMTLERYSHVMHISSTVTGRLSDRRTAFDALRAALPVGTVSGAPKVRAMEIIDELEPTRRGPYGGAVGYVDFRGNMDTCIALRTMVATRAARGWAVDIQAGAGIVYDSVPRLEYEETVNKARALAAAVALAESAGRGAAGKRRR